MSELRIDFSDRDDGDMPRGDDEKIIEEAKDRHRRCKAYYSTADNKWKNDYMFANADADNGYQWPANMREARINDNNRPTLTINQARQHNLQIINDGRQNKPSIKYRPVGGEATMQAAEVLEGIARHVEYISNAQVAYDWARTFQVQAGRGYWRVVTDYADNEGDDQEIYIRRIIDPLSVYLDPDAREFDYSDMKFAFIFKQVPREDFDKQYPEYKDIAQHTLGDDEWVDSDHVIVAEYYRRSEKKDRLMHFTDPQSGQEYNMRESEAKDLGLPDDIWRAVLDDPETRTRDIRDNKIEHYIIVGNEIAERGIWPGRTIPIVPLFGEVTLINGVWDCKGHTRAMIDAQRMLNYWFSAATEHLGLQSKTPYIAGKRAIEGVETYWGTANRVNHSYLVYNDIDDEGNTLAPPQRQDPPTMAPAFVEGMQVAVQQLQAVSGQYAPQMGEPSNERSGKAIAERQRQGDNATYHFIDNEAVAIRRTGKIILEIYPRVMGAKQIQKIQGLDGEQSEVRIDRTQKMALREQKTGEDEITRIFNPDVGKYEVHSDIGPAYSTQRQEAWNAFVQIASMSPDFMKVCADLMFQAADFPMADKIAERFKRTIPPGILGEGLPPPVEQMIQQLQQQLQMAQGTAQKATAQLGQAQKQSMVSDLKLHAKSITEAFRTRELNIDAYKAETERLNTMLDAMTNAETGDGGGGRGEGEGGGEKAESAVQGLDKHEIARLAAQLVLDAMRTPITGNGAA